jgi:hypothetical protein
MLNEYGDYQTISLIDSAPIAVGTPQTTKNGSHWRKASTLPDDSEVVLFFGFCFRGVCLRSSLIASIKMLPPVAALRNETLLPIGPGFLAKHFSPH